MKAAFFLGVTKKLFQMLPWVAFLCCLAMTAAMASISTQQGVPAGFEELDTPRPTLVTLYYGGELLGNFSAHYTPSTLQFDKPDDIISGIPSISDIPAVKAVLLAPLPINADLLCNEHRIENCGNLIPDVVGIIFDESHLSAEIFINKKDLSIINDSSKRYLPLPDRHLSTIYNINGAVSGVDTETPSYTVGYNSTLSFGEARIDSESTISNNGLRFDTAAASVDRYGWSGSTGLFRSRSMQLISDHDIAGVSLATSRRTILDEHKTEGNDIILYLARRSFVSIYREGRLYSSHAYEAGNQTIDTSELPDGAYTITLKIQEVDGETHEETRFFSKSEKLPPPGSPTYYAEAGFIRKPLADDSTIPMVTPHPLARAGTIQRLDDNFGVSVSLLGVQDRAAMEPGIFWMNETSQISTTLLGSTRGDMGVQANWQYINKKLSLSSDFREVWMSDKIIPGDDDLVRQLTQASAMLGYAITSDVTVGIRGSYSKQSGMVTTSSLGPYAQWNIWQQGESTLSLTADAARTGSQNQGSVLLHFSHRLGNYGITGATGTSLGQGGTGPSGNLQVWHDDTTPGNALLVSGGVAADRQDKTIDSDVRWHNDFGQVEGGVQKAFGQFNSPLSYGGNFAMNAALLADELHVGGTQNEKSAIIISTSGDGDTDMRVFVNNTAQATVHVGQEQVIYLTPFHKYNIRLSSQKSALLDYDSGNRLVTLYPGNVAKLEWTVNKFYVVAGHIVAPSGEPLAHAVLQESHAQVITDNKGRFQAELSKPETMTFVSNDKSICEVHTPQNITAHRGVLLYHDALVCVPVLKTISP